MPRPRTSLLLLAGLLAAVVSACSPTDGDWIGWIEDGAQDRAWDLFARIGGGQAQLMKIDITGGNVPDRDRLTSGYRAQLGEVDHPDDNFWFYSITSAETWDHLTDTWSETEVAADATLGFAYFDAGEELLHVAFCTKGMTSTAEGSVWHDHLVRDTQNRFPQ
ncbi:MAG: hypothetical protein ABIJ09_22650 [Pseudomonadota bacterium]